MVMVRNLAAMLALSIVLAGFGAAAPVSAEAGPVDPCDLGPSVNLLTPGVSLAGLLDGESGDACYFEISLEGHLDDPYDPGHDFVRFTVTQTIGNVHLYVKKGAIPTTDDRDCRVNNNAATKTCDLFLTESATYYVMVLQQSGPAAFSIQADPSSTCSLGPGYHTVSGTVTGSTIRPSGAGTGACFFKVESAARDDLFTSLLESLTSGRHHTLSVHLDAPFGVDAAHCSGTAIYQVIFGIELRDNAQCDELIEDNDPHTWYIRVSRGSSVAAAGEFRLTAESIAIPLLLPGVPVASSVATGETRYYKVQLAEDSEFLDIQTQGDPSGTACELGPGLHPTVGLVCLLLPFPELLLCALASDVCAEPHKTLLDRCNESLGDEGLCGSIDDARIDACLAIEEAAPGTCDPADTTGSAHATCRFINNLLDIEECDLNGLLSIKTPKIELLVRNQGETVGLPTSSTSDCRSAQAGTTQRCIFSEFVKQLNDNVTQPVIDDANDLISAVRDIINEHRHIVDDNLTAVQGQVSDTQEERIVPVWEQIRAFVLERSGEDIGAFPDVPEESVPPTPNAKVPDQSDALELPGSGVYLIAVRGPSGLVDTIFHQGGTFTITAYYERPDIGPEDVQNAVLDLLSEAPGPDDLLDPEPQSSGDSGLKGFVRAVFRR